MMRSILAAVLASALTPSLSAQSCVTPVALQTFGATCDYQLQASVISGSQAPNDCKLAITFSDSDLFPESNTLLAGKYLLIGVQQLTPPATLPDFLPGCELVLLPFAALDQSTSVNDIWKFALPPLPPGQVFYAQGLNLYQVVFPSALHVQLSDALQITTL